MRAQQIPQVQTESRTDNQLQTNIIGGVSVLLNSPLAVTSLITGAVLASGSNTVSHKLNQTPSGMIQCNASAAVNFYGAVYGPLTVTFSASAAATCDILFY